MDKTVLAYIFKDDQVLFLYRNKKEKDINKGKYVGIGGHLEKNETPVDALKREIKEETNLDIIDYFYHGEIYFSDTGYEEIMYLFSVYSFNGEISDCDEGDLHWIKIVDISSLNMWEVDKYFIHYILNKNTFNKMSIIYSNSQLKNVVVDEQIKL